MAAQFHYPVLLHQLLFLKAESHSQDWMLPKWVKCQQLLSINCSDHIILDQMKRASAKRCSELWSVIMVFIELINLHGFSAALMYLTIPTAELDLCKITWIKYLERPSWWCSWSWHENLRAHLLFSVLAAVIIPAERGNDI